MVVGAFPEPFLHGGRPAIVVGSGPVARRLARLVHGQRRPRPAPDDANVLKLVRGLRLHGAHGRRPGRLHARDRRRAAARRGRDACPLPLRRPVVSPGPAAALLAALAAAALLAHRPLTVAVIAAGLLVVALRAPRARRRLYLLGVLVSCVSLIVITPFVESIGIHVLWSGPTIPVLGTLDITTEELRNGLVQALRLGSVMLAFAVYALMLDHDRLVQSAGFARRSVLAVALATRLIPTLERDGRGADRGSARARPPAGGGPRARGPALAAPRRVARARAQPCRGDGGPRVRPARAHACAAPALGRARLVRDRRLGPHRRDWGCCGSSARRATDVHLPARRCGRRSTASTSSSSRARSSSSSGARGPGSRRSCGRSQGSCRTSTAAASRAGSWSPGSTRGARIRPRSPGRSRRSSRTRRTRS